MSEAAPGGAPPTTRREGLRGRLSLRARCWYLRGLAPVYGDATHGSIHLSPAQRADHGVGREALSFILSGSRSTWIRFSAPPIKSTLATPSTSSMEGTTSSSA